jgi:hypothetical protein
VTPYWRWLVHSCHWFGYCSLSICVVTLCVFLANFTLAGEVPICVAIGTQQSLVPSCLHKLAIQVVRIVQGCPLLFNMSLLSLPNIATSCPRQPPCKLLSAHSRPRLSNSVNECPLSKGFEFRPWKAMVQSRPMSSMDIHCPCCCPKPYSSVHGCLLCMLLSADVQLRPGCPLSKFCSAISANLAQAASWALRPGSRLSLQSVLSHGGLGVSCLEGR